MRLVACIATNNDYKNELIKEGFVNLIINNLSSSYQPLKLQTQRALLYLN